MYQLLRNLVNAFNMRAGVPSRKIKLCSKDLNLQKTNALIVKFPCLIADDAYQKSFPFF